MRDETLLALNNDTLPVALGWTLYAVVVLAYAGVSLRRAQTRRADGLHADALSVVLAKAAVMAVLLGAVTAYLSQERSRNPLLTSIKGLPIVVVLLAAIGAGAWWLGRDEPAPVVDLDIIEGESRANGSMNLGPRDRPERVVDPRRLEGGRLSAYDHRADDVREFAVHRITAVRPA